ncbi:MAG: hypothetical protein RL226_351 [Bacteroidota bacterium]
MIRSLLLILALASSTISFGAWDIFQSYAILDFGSGNDFRAGGENADAALTFAGTYYGSFRPSDTFILNGGELKTFKNGSSNVCGGTIYYRVYKRGETPGAFNSIAIGFDADLGGGDQRWQTANAGIDLVSGLSEGNYVLQVWFDATGDTTSPTGCSETIVDDNAGNYFQATFSIVDDSFNDGNLTSNVTWTGDTGGYSILDPASFTGTGSNPNINIPYSIHENVLVSFPFTGDAAVVTTNTQAYGVWEFSVATGLGWATTATNNFAVILISDTNDPSKMKIGSMDFNGYFIKWNNSGSLDKFGLFKQEGTTETQIIDFGWPLQPNASAGYSLRIQRNTKGEWIVSGATGFNLGAAMTTYGTVVDNDITTSSYFAVSTNITNPALSRRLYFDNFQIRPLTEVSFTVGADTILEDDVNSTYNLSVSISNPDDRIPTSVDVNLLAGTASKIGGFSSQTLTFPAGSATPQTIALTVSGNTVCEKDEEFLFELDNILGGYGADYGLATQMDLYLDDDESGTELIFSEDFEDGDANGWLNTSRWDLITSTATISGQYDARHVVDAVAVFDYLSYPLNPIDLTTAETIWRFNFATSGFETSANNWVMVALSANEADLFSGTVDGYAIGVNFDTGFDNLRLVRIDNGAYTSLITSSYDWNTNVVLGIEVLRDANGVWSFSYKEGGGFSGMTAVSGTSADATYTTTDFFGMGVDVTAARTGRIRIDDIAIYQYGCYSEWYSVASGDASQMIWSESPVGTGINAEWSRFNNYTIQAGTAVTLDLEAAVRDFNVESGATFNGGADNLRVYENMNVDGTFDGQSGNLIFSGNKTQQVNGTVALSLGNMTLSNTSNTGVIFNTDASLTGIVTPTFGTADVSGINFTLTSDGAGTASIAAFTENADWIGDITLQRFVPSSAGNSWVNFSSPLTGLTLTDWDDDIVTSGFPGSQYPNAQTFEGGLFNNIQLYDETNTGSLNEGWSGAADITDAIDPLTGHMVYMLSGNQTIDVTGGLQKGDLSVPLSFTSSGISANDGWHLVKNPYPCDVDWDVVVANSTGVSTYYVYDNDSGSQLLYNGSTGIGTASQYIASSQSFFVKVDAPGAVLNWTESAKAPVGADFERVASVSGKLTMYVTDGVAADYTFVALDDQATTDFENEFDAYSYRETIFGGNTIQFVSVDAEGRELAINTFGVNTEAISVPLQISVQNAGSYTLHADQVIGALEGVCISIEDTETGAITVVEEGATIAFDMEANETTNRFVLHFSGAVTANVTEMTCFEANDAAIELNLPEGDWTITWYDEMDMPIATNVTSLEGLSMGTYTAEVTNNSLHCAAISVQSVIDNAQMPSAVVSSEYSACNVDDIGEIAIHTQHLDAFQYTLASEGNIVLEGTSENGYVVFDMLPASTYTVTIESACMSETHEVAVLDPNAVSVEAADITAQLQDGSVEVTLTASAENADQITWISNGQEMGTGESFNQTFTVAGTYVYTAMAVNEACAATADVVVTINETIDVTENEIEVLFANIPNGIALTTSDVLPAAEMRIFDVTGKLVDRLKVEAAAGRQEFVFNQLADGAYVVRLISDGQSVAVTRFVK